jgi:hypothetical protein
MFFGIAASGWNALTLATIVFVALDRAAYPSRRAAQRPVGRFRVARRS